MPNVSRHNAVKPNPAGTLTPGRLIACHRGMSPSKPPGRGPKHPGPKATDEPQNPWASYDDADDWSLTGDQPMQRADPTGRLDIAPQTRQKPAAQIQVTEAVVGVQGGEVDRVWPLHQSRMTLGRGADNDIVLADASISRAHAVLERDAQGWTITDLQSGNGTMMAGKRVTAARLPMGQTVALGQVHLRLQAHSAEAQKSAAKPGQKKAALLDAPSVVSALSAKEVRPGPGQSTSARAGAKLLARSTGAFGALRRWPKLAVCAGVLAAALGGWLRNYARHAQAADSAFARCTEGITAFSEQRWDDAEQAFADALAQSPHHALTERYQGALTLARRDAAALAEAQERRERGDFERARASLAALGPTPLAQSAWLEASRYSSALTQVAIQAETALGAGLVAEARSLLDSLGQPPPPRQDMHALAAWSALRAQNADLEEAARTQSLRGKPIPSLWDQAQTQSPAMRAAIGAFRRGSAIGGPAVGLKYMRWPKTPSEQALVAALQRFAKLYETAIVEHRGKRAFAAIKLFGEARAEATKVAGEGSRPARDVDAKMADMYYVLGVQALMTSHLAEASEALHTAVRLRPGHILSIRRLEELNDRAERMVDEAEFMGTTHASKAQEQLHQVIEAMPAQSAVTARARRLLQSLGNRP